MTLSTLMASDVTEVFLVTSDFAGTVTYTPTGGTGRDITVVVEDMGTQLIEDEHHMTEQRRIVVHADDDSATGIDAPQLGDYVTWNSNKYDFQAVVAQEAGMTQCEFTRVVSRREGRSGPMRL